jgi:hypothetical protein
LEKLKSRNKIVETTKTKEPNIIPKPLYHMLKKHIRYIGILSILSEIYLLGE